jgi:hypothetical protein
MVRQAFATALSSLRDRRSRPYAVLAIAVACPALSWIWLGLRALAASASP